MAAVHGKNTVNILDGNDLSPFGNTTDWEESADEHDITTYGKNSHVFAGGLKGGKCSIGGVYDNGADGPRAIVKPLVGTVVVLVHRPEGTGSGKPQDTVDVHVKSYSESNPVADMIMWKAELTLSDDVVSGDQ